MTEEEARQRVIASMCPSRVCRVCGEPSRRIVGAPVYVDEVGDPVRKLSFTDGQQVQPGVRRWGGGERPYSVHRIYRIAETTGFSDCGHDDWRPGVVLDPFQNQEGFMLTLGNIDE